MLDSPNILDRVTELMLFVTESIWVGKLNSIHSRARVETDGVRAAISCMLSNQLVHEMHMLVTVLLPVHIGLITHSDLRIDPQIMTHEIRSR